MHHIIARGIGHRNFFNDDIDRDNFLERLETILCQEDTYLLELVRYIHLIDEELVWAPGKNRLTVKACSLFCYWSVDLLGVSTSSLARQLGLSITSISQSVEHGKRIAAEEKFSFDKIEL